MTRLHTPACDRLGIRYPICQAGMADSTSAELVAAVSRAGGLGVLGALSRTPGQLRELIHATRAALNGDPFGVNHVIGQISEASFALCLAEQVPVIALSWGDPTPWTARAHHAGAIVIYQVTTLEEVPLALAAGVDLLIAQGIEAGGHSGFVSLFELLPAVVDRAQGLPVLAAGGISDGRGLAAMLALGAAGGWLGTRFLATPEAPISPAWKAAIIAAKPGQTIHSAAFDRLWGLEWPGAGVRAIANDFTATWDGREAALAEHLAEVREQVWQAERDDDPALIALLAGTGVGLINDIRPADELVTTIAADAAATIAQLANSTQNV